MEEHQNEEGDAPVALESAVNGDHAEMENGGMSKNQLKKAKKQQVKALKKPKPQARPPDPPVDWSLRPAYRALVEEFRDDPARFVQAFTVGPDGKRMGVQERKWIHEDALEKGLAHYSTGARSDRTLYLLKNPRPLLQGKFSTETQTWIPVTEEDLKSKQLKFEKKKKLKLITFNVMMDCWGNNKKETYNHTDMIYTHERRKAIFSTLDKMNPHIMALQEITIDMHAALLELPWVRERYFVSDLDASNFQPMGILLLSRFPLDRIVCQNYHQQYSIPKTMIFADWFAFHQRHLSFGLVHLKASSGYAETRKREIEETVDVQLSQKGVDDAFLLGDFNFRDADKEGNEELEYRYVDIWQKYYKGTEHSGKPTYDLTNNLMSKAISEKVAAMRGTTGHSSRFDRMYLHSRCAPESQEGAPGEGKEKEKENEEREEGEKEEKKPLREKGSLGDWEIKKMAMFGTDPVYTSPKGEAIFMSDHFGLVATLLYKGVTNIT